MFLTSTLYLNFLFSFKHTETYSGLCQTSKTELFEKKKQLTAEDCQLSSQKAPFYMFAEVLNIPQRCLYLATPSDC